MTEYIFQYLALFLRILAEVIRLFKSVTRFSEILFKVYNCMVDLSSLFNQLVNSKQNLFLSLKIFLFINEIHQQHFNVEQNVIFLQFHIFLVGTMHHKKKTTVRKTDFIITNSSWKEKKNRKYFKNFKVIDIISTKRNGKTILL